MGGGSDFELLLLNNSTIPPYYNVFFNGWGGYNYLVPTTGVGIHHPKGDIKKISHYSGISNGTYNGDWVGATNAHFVVDWDATTNGHGVTEQGSSGSPLIDAFGRVIGTLSGGGSSCSNLNGYDYYGRLGYHWQSNGTNNYQRLQPWLDPTNTYSFLNGINNCNTGTVNCAGAANLTCSNTYTSTTVGGYSLSPSYACVNWNESGPEKVHKITTNATGTITATLSGMTADLDVFILNSCNNNSCVAYGNITATYTSAPAGTYYIVVDGFNGASSAYTLTYNYPNIVSGAPTAYFTNYPTTIYQGQSVHFIDQSTNSPTSRLWTFGDGGTSAIQNPNHTFTNSGNYNVSLKATNSCGNNTYTKYITVLSTAGIEDLVFSESVQIYPNPVFNTFEIKYQPGFKEGSYYQIIDITGKIVQQNLLKVQTNNIDISGLSKGVYSVRIFNGNKVCVKKLIKL